MVDNEKMKIRISLNKAQALSGDTMISLKAEEERKEKATRTQKREGRRNECWLNSANSSSTMSEQQPLLAQPVDDPESQGYGPAKVSWRTKTAKVLEHPVLHKTVITLIAIDAACVIADLSYTFLSPGCPSEGGPESPAWLEVLSQISLVITTLFLIEIPLTLWALGPQFMNPFGPVPHASLHAFDAIIILTTFTLEFVLRGKEKELAGLLIILRLWRIVKLIGGVAVGVGEIDEATLETLAETRRELDKTKAELAAVRQENLDLRQEFDKYVSVPSIDQADEECALCHHDD